MSNNMYYTAINNSKIKRIKQLTKKKYRDQSNCFLVEGKNLILEAYKTGYLEELIVENGEQFKLPIKTNYVTKEIMKSISTLDTSSKIIGICCKKQDNKIEGKRILMVDQVQEPGNLGAIIRSALAFNIKTIILNKNTVDLYNEKVIRATQGMLFYLNIFVSDFKEEIPNLRNKGFKIIGTETKNGKDIKKLVKNEKFAIIVGNEGSGLSKDVKELCDECIYININSQCESLNVAIATSIILYELDK